MVELTAKEAASRLGVKVDTIYAYVSRGVLKAQRSPGSRTSLFNADDVEELARRGRPRRSTRPNALDLVIETRLTTFEENRVLYRGRDVAPMAREATFEQVAHWLWTGEEVTFARAWQPAEVDLPDLADPRQRLHAAVVMASATNALRADLTAPAVVAAGRSLIATMAGSLPANRSVQPARLQLGSASPPMRNTMAGRLWSRLAPGRPSSEQVAILNAALVVNADHELVPSTLAARIAASVRANPYDVVLSGLGALAGRLHGRTNRFAYELLQSATADGAGPALERSLELYGLYPGFGHYYFTHGEPRADLLINMVRSVSPTDPVLTAADEVIDVARRHADVHPNIDLALAVVALTSRMPPYAGEAILTIARTAGWLAHALEEYAEPPFRFRASAIPRN